MRKVKLTVNNLCRSPVKNDNLQVEVERVYGKRLSIVRDCKTQWSSLYTMLERFLKIVKMLEEYDLISLMATNLICFRKCNLAH